MIVELLEYKGYLLALNDQSELLLWNITSQFPLDLPHSVSLLPTIATYKHDQPILALVKNSQKVFLHNYHSIICVDLTLLPTLNLSEVKLEEDLKGQHIRCMVSVEDGKLLVATHKGNLVVIDVEMGTVTKKVSFWEQIKGEKEVGRLSTGFEKVITINCLSLGRGAVFVGMENGKIYGVDSTQLILLFEVTAKQSTPLEPVFKLKLLPEEDRIYSIHRNYIVEWNYRLGTCLSYVECASPHGIAKSKNGGGIVAGLSSSFWVKGEQSWELSLSMRGTGALLELGAGTVAIGGSDNLVDIFTDSTRLLTLIPKC